MVRILCRVALPLAVFVGLGWLALQAYLRGGPAASKVAARLQAALGVPVTVGGVEVHAAGCAASDVHVFEAGESVASRPFFTVGRAVADLKVTDVVFGTIDPQLITLTDAELTLRHDRDGRLLTRLPPPASACAKLPQVQFENARLTLKKNGDPDCRIQGFTGTLDGSSGQLQLVGTVCDPSWGGTWKVSGSFSPDGRGMLGLESPPVHVTPDMLRRVPFVDPKVWHHVVAEGDTPVDVRLTLRGRDQPVSYRVMLTPSNTAVFVSSIDLRADQARGVVVIEDERVLLTDVRGRVAGGRLTLRSADLDFRKPASVMTYDLAADGLELHGLPASWRLPPRLGGRLSGEANLIVRVVNGHAIPTGSGDGRVDGATIGFFPIPNYGLRIQADRNGFRFEPRIGERVIRAPARPAGEP